MSKFADFKDYVNLFAIAHIPSLWPPSLMLRRSQLFSHLQTRYLRCSSQPEWILLQVVLQAVPPRNASPMKFYGIFLTEGWKSLSCFEEFTPTSGRGGQSYQNASDTHCSSGSADRIYYVWVSESQTSSEQFLVLQVLFKVKTLEPSSWVVVEIAKTSCTLSGFLTFGFCVF